MSACQAAIGKSTAAFVAARSKALQKCWDGRLNGKHSGDCTPPAAGDGKYLGAIAKAHTKQVTTICKACGGPDKACGQLDDLMPAAIGLPTDCTALTPPEGGNCNVAITDLASLIACVDCVAGFETSCIDRLHVPGLTPYPDACSVCLASDAFAFPVASSWPLDRARPRAPDRSRSGAVGERRHEHDREIALGTRRARVEAEGRPVLRLGTRPIAEPEVRAPEIVVGVGVLGVETDGGEIRVARPGDLVATEVEVAEVAVGRRRVGGVRERLQRAVVAARDAAREDFGREETRQRVPTLDRGVPDDEEEVVPEKGVRERVRVDDEHDGDDEADVPRDDRRRVALPGAVAVSGVSSRHGTLVER